MAGSSFLKRAPNHAPNHKPPIQFQMLAAWYYISFFLVHGISLIEIGARFKNDLPAIIKNKKSGVRYCISAEKVRFGWVRVGPGGFRADRPGSGGFGRVRVVPCLSMYDKYKYKCNVHQQVRISSINYVTLSCLYAKFRWVKSHIQLSYQPLSNNVQGTQR